MGFQQFRDIIEVEVVRFLRPRQYLAFTAQILASIPVSKIKGGHDVNLQHLSLSRRNCLPIGQNLRPNYGIAGLVGS